MSLVDIDVPSSSILKPENVSPGFSWPTIDRTVVKIIREPLQLITTEGGNIMRIVLENQLSPKQVLDFQNMFITFQIDFKGAGFDTPEARINLDGVLQFITDWKLYINKKPIEHIENPHIMNFKMMYEHTFPVEGGTEAGLYLDTSTPTGYVRAAGPVYTSGASWPRMFADSSIYRDGDTDASKQFLIPLRYIFSSINSIGSDILPVSSIEIEMTKRDIEETDIRHSTDISGLTATFAASKTGLLFNHLLLHDDIVKSKFMQDFMNGTVHYKLPYIRYAYDSSAATESLTFNARVMQAPIAAFIASPLTESSTESPYHYDGGLSVMELRITDRSAPVFLASQPFDFAFNTADAIRLMTDVLVSEEKTTATPIPITSMLRVYPHIAVKLGHHHYIDGMLFHTLDMTETNFQIRLTTEAAMAFVIIFMCEGYAKVTKDDAVSMLNNSF